MTRPSAPRSRLIEAAALSRMKEMRTVASTGTDPKAAVRAIWALGDYHAFATATVWEVGPVLVEAWSVAPGMRVLDVAAGSGNVAIRAALAGAEVVACDLTPENFEAGRREARAVGVEPEWVEADAESLPFGDGSFDVVASSFGAIFAPDQRAVARELARVCRPGGTIGMANFTPEGLGAEFFAWLARHAPPPAGTPSPLSWGSEDHVRDLLGDRVASLRTERRTYVERAPSPRAYCELFTRTFGPVVAVRAALADRPERAAAFDRDLLEWATRANAGGPGDGAAYPYEYLLVVAETRAGG